MQQRLEQVKNIINKEGLGGLLITSRPNTYYFTGFSGSTSKCLVTKDKAYLIVDFRYTIQAKEQAYAGIEVIQYSQGVLETLNTLCLEYGVTELGIEGSDITFADHLNLQQKLQEVQSFKDIQEKLDRIRIVKDEHELLLIQKAVDIADKVFEEILPYLKPGVKEYEIALEMEYKMKKMGASGESFETIVASGPRSALPHGVAGMREIQTGDAIVMDFGAVYKGYCSDMTRTVFVGNPDQELKHIYDVVLKSQLAALSKARTGMNGKELDDVSRSIIYGAGYEKCFGHGLGHGVGVEIHEKPTVSPRGEETLEEGMVFTIEPGIYVEGLGGIRIEDMVCLKQNGLQILTKSTKDMIIL